MSNTKKFVKNYKLRKAKHKDKIPGGVADNRKPSDFDKKQLSMGIKVEMEHTNDRAKAMEIAMDHLAEDPKYYTKLKQVHDDTKKSNFIDSFKKSYDFRDVKVSVDAVEHAEAEKTASPELLEYLSTSVNSDLEKIPFEKGALTLYKKEDGLYSGFFQDKEGQIIQKFDDMTIPILAKNMEVKELYTPVPAQHDEQEAEEDAAIAEYVAARLLDHHNEVYHRGQEPGEPINNGKGSLRIKMGDIDIEIKKSINSFIKSHKQNKEIEVIKAIQSWRRNCVGGKNFSSDLEAGKELLKEWEKYSEEFYQIMHAMRAGDE